MWTFLAPILLLLHGAVAAPVENAAAAATVGKIRGVRDPIYHLYLQANSKNGTHSLSHPSACFYFTLCRFSADFIYMTDRLSSRLTSPASIPVLGPESAADEFTIGGTIQSKKTGQFLNIQTVSTSYKPLVWGATGDTTAWGLEGDTIITVQGSSYGRRECDLLLILVQCLMSSRHVAAT